MSNDVILVPPLDGGHGIYCLYESGGKPVGSTVCRSVEAAVFQLGPRALRDYDGIILLSESGMSREDVMARNADWARGL